MTYEQFVNWLGEDSLNTDELVSIILELANGQYSIEQFNKDVAEW